jgi:dihydropteroate synthase
VTAPTSAPPLGQPSRVLFVTGRLAEPALRQTLERMAPSFACDVAVMHITVAALMTTPWIARFLQVPLPQGTDLVLIPGLCEGDTSVISKPAGVRVEKGPKDVREIPEYFGHAALQRDYGAWDIEILAEINHAPRGARNEIQADAQRYRASGADYIDIGCTPGLAFPALGAVVRELVDTGLRVSIDSFDRDEILTAVHAGASLVLSVNSTNLDVARELSGRGVRVVVIPDFGGSLDTLEPSIALLRKWDVPFLIDPVIEPIGFGFAASLARYIETRRRYPDAEMMMGIGNLTELTAADSTGVNAILVGICQELGVHMVLTTEVIGWAHGAVREIDIARRLMHYAVHNKVVPKRVDDRLVTITDAKILTYTEAELRDLQSRITDPNFRIFTDRDTITVLNRDLFVRGTDIQEIFNQLGVSEATHAFYLGKELAKAKLAITLGKTYRQEGTLNWGYLTPPDDPVAEHVRLTQRSARTERPERAAPARPSGDPLDERQP